MDPKKRFKKNRKAKNYFFEKTKKVPRDNIEIHLVSNFCENRLKIAPSRSPDYRLQTTTTTTDFSQPLSALTTQVHTTPPFKRAIRAQTKVTKF